MRTIKGWGEYESEIKRSRFLCALNRVTEETQVREFLAYRRKLHHSARHHCSAYILGEDAGIQKSSDDGEPAGTAGTPMLDVLRRNELTNTLAVVSRYFGGVLLGAGGLVRAYGGAVSAALEQVRLVELRPMRVVSTTVDYGLAGKLENQLRSAGHHISDVHYGKDVRFELRIDDSSLGEFETWLAEVSAGAAALWSGELTHAEIEL